MRKMVEDEARAVIGEESIARLRERGVALVWTAQYGMFGTPAPNDDTDQCDLLVLPAVTTVPLSPLVARIRKMGERLQSPFDAEGSPIMMGTLRDAEHIGLIVTARFSVEGEGNVYTINGKVKGSAISIIREGDGVRVYEGGDALVVSRAFEASWKGRRVTGMLWLQAVHLPLDRKFVLWLNNGRRLGDIERRLYRVTASGLVRTSA